MGVKAVDTVTGGGNVADIAPDAQEVKQPDIPESLTPPPAEEAKGPGRRALRPDLEDQPAQSLQGAGLEAAQDIETPVDTETAKAVKEPIALEKVVPPALMNAEAGDLDSVLRDLPITLPEPEGTASLEAMKSTMNGIIDRTRVLQGEEQAVQFRDSLGKLGKLLDRTYTSSGTAKKEKVTTTNAGRIPVSLPVGGGATPGAGLGAGLAPKAGKSALSQSAGTTNVDLEGKKAVADELVNSLVDKNYSLDMARNVFAMMTTLMIEGIRERSKSRESGREALRYMRQASLHDLDFKANMQATQNEVSKTAEFINTFKEGLSLGMNLAAIPANMLEKRRILQEAGGSYDSEATANEEERESYLDNLEGELDRLGDMAPTIIGKTLVNASGAFAGKMKEISTDPEMWGAFLAAVDQAHGQHKKLIKQAEGILRKEASHVVKLFAVLQHYSNI